MAFCPKCRRPFEDKAGFCPFDGSELIDGAGAPQSTIDDESSAPVVAVSAAGDDTNAALELLTKKGEEKPSTGLIGKTLDGRYQIKSVLGEGGMGIVFLAEHVVIEKLVAVKVLKKDAARNDSVSKRFVREAKAASRIGHPNIIDVTDFGTTKNGTMGVDAIVFFDRELATGFAHRQLQAGQLMSKSRFLGAQMEAYLSNDLWLHNARAANANAARLAAGIKDAPGLRLPLGAEANQLFPIMTRRLYDHLIAAGAQFAIWPGVGSLIDAPGEDELQTRLVTSFNTAQQDIDKFIAAVHAA